MWAPPSGSRGPWMCAADDLCSSPKYIVHWASTGNLQFWLKAAFCCAFQGSFEGYFDNSTSACRDSQCCARCLFTSQQPQASLPSHKTSSSDQAKHAGSNTVRRLACRGVPCLHTQHICKLQSAETPPAVENMPVNTSADTAAQAAHPTSRH